jgi:hypothetical protein
MIAVSRETPAVPDRKAERAELSRILRNGHSIQMLAPRRVGKTWLMHKVAGDVRTHGWTAVFIDVEGMGTQDEFLRELCRKIEELGTPSQRIFTHLGQRLRQLASNGWDGNPLNAIGRIDAKAFSDALVASLNAQDTDTLILVDEIALFVTVLLAKDAQATLDFLYHLRKLRQTYPRVKWLLTGSIGLDVVARRAGLQGALVGLEIFPLEPFGEPAARAFLNSICGTAEVRSPFELDDAVFRYLARELGWLSPYYLRLIADRIRPTGEPALSGRRFALTPDIDAAFDDLLNPAYRPNFATWEEHIDKNFPQQEAALLHAILCVLCERADGETFATLQARLGAASQAPSARDLKNLLTALVNDGFLHEVGGRFRFRSGLLRRYWAKYLHE